MSLRLFAAGLAAAIALTAADAVATGGRAGTCRKDAREISRSEDNVVQLSGYVCRSDRDPQAQVRVEFQRLSGLAAGALLNNGSAPWTTTLYGKYRIVDNDVLKEYRNLLTRFGSAVRAKDAGGGESITISLRINTPEQASGDEAKYASARKGAEIRSFKLPDLPDLPLVDETVEILTKQTWPDSLSMYYAVWGYYDSADDATKSPFDEMTVWRYLTPADLKDYARRMERYNSLVADRNYGTRKRMPKALQFLEYVTAGGWPENFLYASASVKSAEPCVALDFRVEQHAFVVDVAVIENTSSKAINIDQLLGRSGGANQLRRVSSPAARIDGVALGSAPVTLAPAERLIVPTGLVFSLDPLSVRTSEDPEKGRRLSQHRYRKITDSRPGTVFRTDVFAALRGTRAKDSMVAIRKLRESFKPPSFPIDSEFAFGPEWSLNGLALGGEHILFDAVAPNFLEITAANEIGSCPILYAWSAPDATWFRHGKIIHQAQSRVSKQSEIVTFTGVVHRFRIAEEELERATIGGVTLRLELVDGRALTLPPASVPLAAGTVVELYANDEIEIDFVLPVGLKVGDVVRSQLTVTGYYDRYPALLLGRQ